MASSIQDILLVESEVQNGTACHRFIKNLIANERAQSAIQDFGTYAPFIVSSLIAFIHASNLGLKFSIALSKAPLPYRSDADLKKKRRLFIAVMLFNILQFFFGFFWAREAKIFLKVYLCAMTFIVINAFLTKGSCLLSLTAHRTTDGTPCLQILKKYKFNLFVLSVLVAPLVAIGAVTMSVHFLSWIGLTSFTFAIASVKHQGRLGFVLNTVLFFSIILTQVNLLTTTPLENTLWFMSKWSSIIPDLDYIWTWCMPSLLMGLPGVILSQLLRFDYKLHLERNPDTDRSEYLQTTQVSDSYTNYVERVGSGVVLPSKTPRGFRRTYFNTALISWLICQLFMLLVAILRRGGRNDSAVVNYLFHFVPLGLQAIGIAVAVRGYQKGELRQLLSYWEVWAFKPIPLPAIMVTTPEDEEKKDDPTVSSVEV